MGNQIVTHGVVNAGQKGDFELRANAVGAGHEHRVGGAGKGRAKQCAEAADVTEHLGVERRLCQVADAALGFLSGRQIHAGVTVCHHGGFPIQR